MIHVNPSDTPRETPLCPHGQKTMSYREAMRPEPSPPRKLTNGFFPRSEDVSGIGLRVLAFLTRIFG